ncbi:MAG: helix-turn-helix domain-containing protein [Candidatus Altiarchaeota archaeon]|nr:helix-turn-helix domain-containing protein [Candidatus Altiarchaeota archaeon]
MILLVLLMVSTAHAGDGIFESAKITPPELPQMTEGVVLSLVDIESGKHLKDLHVRIELMDLDSGKELNTIRYFRDCNISLDIAPGRWLLVLKADNLSTEGKDFYEMTPFTYLNSSAPLFVSAYMKPVGSVVGEVVDGEGRVVVKAKVRFDCSSDYGVREDVETDSYGLFRGDWLPAGLCKISALYNNQVGSVDVTVEKGELKEVSIVLEKTTTSSITDYGLYLLLIFLAAALLYLFYRKERKSSHRTVKETGPIEPSEGMLSVMETLKEEQKGIINALLEEGGEMKQVDICYKTSIPKASVSRYISYLESRKILETTRIGRLKEVKLSEWFLAQ